ncbi:preprotein translocase subunit SecG [Candidatus Falkowbacteria bacterium]|nr:preprotein translocase subunit SecG [Candidatus Falkowbacteria bacterium]
MNTAIISAIQIVVAILLIACVLLQNRGTGMGAVFGGEGNVYKTKRGAEKALFWATVVLAALFLGLALVVFII